MLALGSIAFLTPYALVALLAVPVIWWLLRFTPPRPELVHFPPIRFLLGLVSREETPHTSPWWLTALRTLLAVLVILAAANPVLNPHEALTRTSHPLLIVLDDGWASAAGWNQRIEALERIVNETEQTSRQVALVTTAPRATPLAAVPGSAADFRNLVKALEPQPLQPDRAALASRLTDELKDVTELEILWLTDGLDYGAAAQFADDLGKLAGGDAELSVFSPASSDTALAIGAPEVTEGGIDIGVRRAGTDAQANGRIRALALNGRSLGEGAFTFDAGATESSARLELPVALRNQVARLEILNARTAGSVFLLDDRWRRKAVGIMSGEAQEVSQPLLSAVYYLQRAIEPFADVKIASTTDQDATLEALLSKGMSVLAMADIGTILPKEKALIEEWVDNGGILVRFAGPRLAGGSDDLVPVKLRRGGRALGGALSWTKPQPLAAFESDSPFFGLEPPAEVAVKRQVLAQPSVELADRTWARLADGTPLVTGMKKGSGLIVLFHVPANPEWSNLPLSGLFVEMLKRIVDLAQGVTQSNAVVTTATAATSAAYTPLRTLDGFGALVDPPPAAAPIPASEIAGIRPQPQHPPGLYRRGGHSYALNLAGSSDTFALLPGLPGGVTASLYQSGPEEPLRGLLLVLAVVLLLIDGLAVLVLSGRLGLSWSRGAAAGTIVLCAALLAAAPGARAQDVDQNLPADDQYAMRASLDTRLGFVVTGNATIDNTSRAGLTGLSSILHERTALEPAGPIGIDIERDEIVFFPLIYWPITQDSKAPSEAAAVKIDTYLKNGGTIFFDTRDHQISVPSVGGGELSATQVALRRVLRNLDVPALEVVPADHVLTKAFYLLQAFPGRWEGGRLWVEASQSEESRERRRGSSNFDGVSSIIIGSNDYAAAWAMDLQGKPLYPVVPGGQRQRELAFRSGINIVMYALTGNYKADQVHVPALLERLGQ